MVGKHVPSMVMGPLNRAPVEPPVDKGVFAADPVNKAPVVESAGVAHAIRRSLSVQRFMGIAAWAPVAVDTVAADPLTKTSVVESVATPADSTHIGKSRYLYFWIRYVSPRQELDARGPTSPLERELLDVITGNILTNTELY